MSEHEEIQLHLPDYAASRLEGRILSRVDEHVAGCLECREMVETLRGLGAALREGGERLFAPHPSESALREFAGLRGGTRPDAIARHLEDCASCSLEVGMWTRRADRPWSDRSVSPGFSRWRSIALASAAGLAIGFGLAVLLRAGREPGAPPSSRGAHTATEAGGSAGRLLLLPRALRGEATAAIYTLDPDQTFVVIACPASIPDSAAPGTLFQYEIRKEAGGVVWSRALTAADIRNQLTSGAEVVTLLVPARSLGAGRYEFRLAPGGAPEEPIYHAAIDVSLGEAPG